mgnify:CR=1 FL=1
MDDTRKYTHEYNGLFFMNPKGTDQYAVAARAAMRTFAQSMHGHNNDLADYVKAWAESETPK